MNEWPAMRKWSLDYFLENFAASRLSTIVDLPEKGTLFSHPDSPHVRVCSMSDFVDLIESPARKRPCYSHDLGLNELQGIAGDVEFPRIDGQSIDGPQAWSNLWIGSAGTRVSFHIDFMDNFLAQIVGQKRLLLASPNDSARMYPSRRNISESAVDLDDLRSGSWPKFETVSLFEGVLGPGEMIFIPAGWWHEVRSLSTSISVNRWWPIADSRVSPLATLLKACPTTTLAAIAWQFAVHGALGRAPAGRLYSGATTGALLWRRVLRRIEVRRTRERAE